LGQRKALPYAWRILTPHRKVSPLFSKSICRDAAFKSIVNVIPLEGGFCMVRPAVKISKSTMQIFCIHRLFQLTFESETEMQDWIQKINVVLSKQVLIETYSKRYKRQKELIGS
jgi:hypothetical protein